MKLNTKVIDKGWGREIIFASNKFYCGKMLCFDKAGAKCSMHYHAMKMETWMVTNGSFKVWFVDTNNAVLYTEELKSGDVWHNNAFFPHQLEAMEDDSVIVEVSTADMPEDNYRILPGDSQNVQEKTVDNG